MSSKSSSAITNVSSSSESSTRTYGRVTQERNHRNMRHIYNILDLLYTIYGWSMLVAVCCRSLIPWGRVAIEHQKGELARARPQSLSSNACMAAEKQQLAHPLPRRGAHTGHGRIHHGRSIQHRDASSCGCVRIAATINCSPPASATLCTTP